MTIPFSGVPQSDWKSPGKFLPRAFAGMEWHRQFTLSNSSAKIDTSVGTVCLELNIDRLNSRLTDFRVGYTELNETRENANKITLSRVQWKLRCDGALLIAEGVLDNVGYGTFTIKLSHRLDELFRLTAIQISRGNHAASKVRMVAIELRANEQRRGQILSQGIQLTDGAWIGYDAASIGEQGANDVSSLYHNSEWLDLGLRRGDKKILLSVELPVLREVETSAR